MIVDPNAVLPRTVARLVFEPVAGQDAQIVDSAGRVDQVELRNISPRPL